MTRGKDGILKLSGRCWGLGDCVKRGGKGAKNQQLGPPNWWAAGTGYQGAMGKEVRKGRRVEMREQDGGKEGLMVAMGHRSVEWGSRVDPRALGLRGGGTP